MSKNLRSNESLNLDTSQQLKTALSKSLVRFASLSGPNIAYRTEKFLSWWQTRIDSGIVEFFKSIEEKPIPTAKTRDYYGNTAQGVNYGNQDYLSLSSHPEILDAAIQTIHDFGIHSAGSGPLQGNTPPTRLLESRLAELFKTEDCLLYPTGWAAGFGLISGLVRSRDYIIIDKLAHQCLKQGAQAATQKISNFEHLNNHEVELKLKNIRATDTKNGILVVTEGLFSMDSDKPQLEELQALCQSYNATLLVDVAHDFGATGPSGIGTLEIQNLIGKVDIVMGSFSKTFASAGGFVVASRAVINYLKGFSGPYTFSNMLSPLQANVVHKALSIVTSDEGSKLRTKLANNITFLRQELTKNNLPFIGEPSPIVPVLIGEEKVALIANQFLFNKGVSANLIEFPGVPLGKARFRLQIMANHEQKHAVEASKAMKESVEEAHEYLQKYGFNKLQI